MKNGYFAEYGDGTGRKHLSDIIADLFSEQLAQWPQLRSAYDALQQTREREIACNGFNVRLRYNSLRTKSTTANIDEKSIEARPCFLCSDNLPHEQRSILYRNNYRILCNPMPAFEYHVTIAAIEHCPQRIDGNTGVLFQLIEDLGSGWMVLYNGPRCGASAPDHNHFQAIPSGLLPIEHEVFSTDGCSNDIRIVESGREIIVLGGRDKAALHSAFRHLLRHIGSEVSGIEPMMNIAGTIKEDEFRIFIFPRSRHRPESYFLNGDERIVVSPAVIEMCGVIITPVERDFERITSKEIESIYREVSLQTNLTARK